MPSTARNRMTPGDGTAFDPSPGTSVKGSRMKPHRVGARSGLVLALALLALAPGVWEVRARGDGPATASAIHLEPTSAHQGPRFSLEGAVGWINTDGPVHLEQLRGKIVVLDFWTYCCINCHHVLPLLAELEQKYKNQVVVVGVHTAKFDAERDTENIRSKVREYGIKHPVANDANQVIWDRFAAKSWPTIAVIDPTGAKVYQQGGEGQADLEATIKRLIDKARSRGELDETPVEFPSEVDRPHEGGLLYPGKITADAPSKRLFVTDTGHNRIVVADLDGKVLATIGDGKPGRVDGDFAAASFHRPQGTCLFEDILYIADTENHALRAVDLRAGTVKTVAGTGQQGNLYAASGKGTAIPLNSPWDVIPIPGTRTLALAMAGPHQIWRYDVARGTVASWAGSGYENILDGTLSQARFAQPSGLATDGQHLFVADSEVSGLRSITLGSQNRVSTIVGTGLFGFGDVDGKGEAARLQHCLGVAYGDGKLYVADTYNNRIKVCDPKTRAVKALVGAHERGSSDDPPRFNEPGGLSLAGPTLYVADTNNHRIRAVDLTTKVVRTLDLSGLKPPGRERAPRFANATLIEVPPVGAMPGNEVNLDVTLALPAGYKLSAEAPLVYLAEADQPGTFTAEVSPTGGRVEAPAREFALKLPLAKQAPTGSKLTVKLSVSAFVCLPNSLCTVKNFVWNIPITFEPGQPTRVKLTTALK